MWRFWVLSVGVVCAALGSPCAADLQAQEAELRSDSVESFHQGRRYGSESLFSPVTVILNKGFDIVQLESSSRYIWDFPYRNGFTRFLPDVVFHPASAVERNPGWGQWLRTEVLPLSLGDARWVVNWTEHLLGGGLTYRRLADWYAVRGLSHPKLVAGVTTMAAAALNEVVEHPDVTLGTSSSVADLWLFDLGGVLLFTWDRPARWAVRYLELADWSNMASFVLPSGELENNGQYLVMKVPLPRVDERLFVRLGLGVQFGITTPLDGEHALTGAVGVDTRGRVVDGATGRETIEFMYSGGLYLDRNNSLLASITFRDQDPRRLAVNVYPGVGPGPLEGLGV